MLHLSGRGSKPGASITNGVGDSLRIEWSDGDDLERCKAVAAGDDVYVGFNLLIEQIGYIANLVAIELKLQNLAVITSLDIGVFDSLIFTLVKFEQSQFDCLHVAFGLENRP